MFQKLSIAWVATFVFALVVPDSASAFFPGPHCGTACVTARNAALFSALPMQIANALVFLVASYSLGRLVLEHGWPVGYTRKILAVTLYATPFVTGYWWSAGLTWWTITLAAGINLLCVGLLSERFRSRSTVLATAFAAIDRPEDRPFTLIWLITAIAATWAVVMLWHATLPMHPAFLMIAFFVSGIGDALAEPVGLRFGRHTYTVRALGTARLYTRSLEGSACVFLSAVVGLVLAHQFAGKFLLGVSFASVFPVTGQFALTLVLVPLFATIAEARSPHTWDQPFIIASCGIAFYAAQEIASAFAR